ncbi:RagB/SusD family nutrient uptake outer membrane protein [Bacteroides nordii]|uniref:RagB/SusD family nutrient uptake outer membrane protein n=1 Tax=Bacteroides nordii TaxID=291645 RepID=UPI0026DB9AB8|nr:RagB/SusD family nutrient uptake outer membrane protein [Bacteroides nordii]
MKKSYIIGMVLLGMCVASCDFLEREPKDFGDENAYFKNPNDLMMSVNKFYEILPKMEAGWGGLYAEDNTSDNQIGTGASNLFYKGDKKTIQQGTSAWKFETLRGINFFINKTEAEVKAGNISGAEEFINHYLGEGYFFRAYDYYRLLKNYGDVPILTEVQVDDSQILSGNSKRYPRNEVVRFILSDLDKAIALMMKEAPDAGRLSKDAALVMKARVALYEATWEKYHAGTCFVPGNPKWPGASTWPDFQFVAGSAEAEVNFFLDQAIAAADSVATHRALDKDYIGMFNSLETFANNDEVILARYYATSVIVHGCSNYLGKSGGGTGFTRALVNSFLTTGGLPIYAEGSGYKGDKTVYEEKLGRDNRLWASMKAGGLLFKENGVDTLSYFIPQIHLTGNESATTGYQINKFVSKVEGQDSSNAGTSATPIFRAAEAYLIYLEAYYERHGRLGGNCDTYWRALRTRAGVNANYQLTIDATDLSRENDLSITWKGNYIDKTLYNIRRERRCELMAEGLRLDDLKRWRALDNMVNYQVEGMNLWEEMYTLYKADQIKEGIVSQAGVSTYIRPLQKSASGIAYNGYTFPKQHYLEPLPISEFVLTTNQATGKPVLYQNPGWPSDADGTADYSYDCD